MKKQEFLQAIQSKLSGLPKNEVNERLNFYSEIIDDKIEEGISEEVAVAEIGTVNNISEQILKDIPLMTIAKQRIAPQRKLKAWEIVLIAVGSPIWLSLLVSAFSVVISVYAVIWVLVISFWAILPVFVGCSIGGIVGGIIIMASGYSIEGLFLMGGGIICAGLAIFTYFGCIEFTKLIIVFTKKIALLIKKCFVKKEEA